MGQPPNLRARFVELSSTAQLDILVPTSYAFDPTTLFHNGQPARLSSAPSRRHLYFDETTQLNIILRSCLGERAVRTLLANAELTLTAHATDAVPQGQGNAASASGKQDLAYKTLPGLDLSNVLFAGEQTYVIWKPTMHISRPPARYRRPVVYFTVALGLTSTVLGSYSSERDVLTSFEPLPANVLEALHFDPSWDGAGSFLPEDRITKVFPASTAARDELTQIRGATKRALAFVPAILTRIRYSTLPDAVIASIYFAASHLIQGLVTLTLVDLDINGAIVRSLTPSATKHGLRASDEHVALYKLVPRELAFVNGVHSGTVKIQAKVQLDSTAEVDLETSWQTQIDLTKRALMSTYRWSRPLSGGTLQPPQRPSLQSLFRPLSSELDRKGHTDDAGMTFNFTARALVKPSDEVVLNVHCVNHSSRARRFALVVLHPRRPLLSSHQRQSSGVESQALVNSIFDASPSPRNVTPDILDLSPDVRFGPLHPGAVFETQMKFRAVATGPLNLGVVRIVDLDTRQTVDVRELPDVVALAPR